MKIFKLLFWCCFVGFFFLTINKTQAILCKEDQTRLNCAIKKGSGELCASVNPNLVNIDTNPSGWFFETNLIPDDPSLQKMYCSDGNKVGIEWTRNYGIKEIPIEISYIYEEPDNTFDSDKLWQKSTTFLLEKDQVFQQTFDLNKNVKVCFRGYPIRADVFFNDEKLYKDVDGNKCKEFFYDQDKKIIGKLKLNLEYLNSPFYRNLDFIWGGGENIFYEEEENENTIIFDDCALSDNGMSLILPFKIQKISENKYLPLVSHSNLLYIDLFCSDGQMGIEWKNGEIHVLNLQIATIVEEDVVDSDALNTLKTKPKIDLVYDPDLNTFNNVLEFKKGTKNHILFTGIPVGSKIKFYDSTGEKIVSDMTQFLYAYDGKNIKDDAIIATFNVYPRGQMLSFSRKIKIKFVSADDSFEDIEPINIDGNMCILKLKKIKLMDDMEKYFCFVDNGLILYKVVYYDGPKSDNKIISENFFNNNELYKIIFYDPAFGYEKIASHNFYEKVGTKNLLKLSKTFYSDDEKSGLPEDEKNKELKKWEIFYDEYGRRLYNINYDITQKSDRKAVNEYDDPDDNIVNKEFFCRPADKTIEECKKTPYMIMEYDDPEEEGGSRTLSKMTFHNNTVEKYHTKYEYNKEGTEILYIRYRTDGSIYSRYFYEDVSKQEEQTNGKKLIRGEVYDFDGETIIKLIVPDYFGKIYNGSNFLAAPAQGKTNGYYRARSYLVVGSYKYGDNLDNFINQILNIENNTVEDPSGVGKAFLSLTQYYENYKENIDLRVKNEDNAKLQKNLEILKTEFNYNHGSTTFEQIIPILLGGSGEDGQPLGLLREFVNRTNGVDSYAYNKIYNDIILKLEGLILAINGQARENNEGRESEESAVAWVGENSEGSFKGFWFIKGNNKIRGTKGDKDGIFLDFTTQDDVQDILDILDAGGGVSALKNLTKKYDKWDFNTFQNGNTIQNGGEIVEGSNKYFYAYNVMTNQQKGGYLKGNSFFEEDPTSEKLINKFFQSKGGIPTVASWSEKKIALEFYVYFMDRKYIQYLYDWGDCRQTVAETVARGGGDCDDFAHMGANLLYNIFKRLNLQGSPENRIYVNSFDLDCGGGHAAVIFETGNNLYYLETGSLFQGRRNPHQFDDDGNPIEDKILLKINTNNYKLINENTAFGCKGTIERYFDNTGKIIYSNHSVSNFDPNNLLGQNRGRFIYNSKDFINTFDVKIWGDTIQEGAVQFFIQKINNILSNQVNIECNDWKHLFEDLEEGCVFKDKIDLFLSDLNHENCKKLINLIQNNKEPSCDYLKNYITFKFKDLSVSQLIYMFHNEFIKLVNKKIDDEGEVWPDNKYDNWKSSKDMIDISRDGNGKIQDLKFKLGDTEDYAFLEANILRGLLTFYFFENKKDWNVSDINFAAQLARQKVIILGGENFMEVGYLNKDYNLASDIKNIFSSFKVLILDYNSKKIQIENLKEYAENNEIKFVIQGNEFKAWEFENWSGYRVD